MITCPRCNARLDVELPPDRGQANNLVPEPARPERAVFASTALVGCAVCGGKTVSIRGRRPGDEQREVCPTCLAETLDDLRAVLAGANRPAL